MTVPPVFARPDRLQRFRVTAGAMADGLERRRWALADAVDEYGRGSEVAYEADTAGADDAVHTIAVALRELGEWVGLVGDAFDAIDVGIDGIRLASVVELSAALPTELRLDVADEPGSEGSDPSGPSWSSDLADVAGLTAARAAATGVRATDLQVLALAVGRERAVGRALETAGRSSRVTNVGRFLDIAAAARAGAAEAVDRWSAEADRPTIERGARAGLDGILTAGGGYGGAAGGALLGGELCAASVVAVPLCMSAGARAGGIAGAAAAEWVSDRLLGDEPEAWERDPVALADEIGDVDGDALDAAQPAIDEVAAAAAAAADRHNGFVLDHPWLWDDEHTGAPHHDPPPPGPDQPARGPS